MSSGDMTSEYKDKQGGGAGQPLTKSENNDGKKTLTNGMSRVHRVLTEDEIASGRSTRWTELEIHGNHFWKLFQFLFEIFPGRVKNLSPSLWQLTHLSALFLNNNGLTRLPPEIAQVSD